MLAKPGGSEEEGGNDITTHHAIGEEREAHQLLDRILGK
jgi:hypothetical protein